MTSLTSTGFSKSTLSDRIAELVGIWQSALGASVDTDPESRDGQIIAALSEMFANLDDIAEATYNGLLPDGATGDFLARLVQINGITKNAGAYSTATCTFSGTAGTVIPTTAIIRCTSIQDQDVTFSPTAPVTIGGGGTTDATVVCNTMGDYQAPAGTLTRIQTVISGWSAVTNAADATRGYASESDERLRARRIRSVAAPSQSMVDGLYAAVANLDNVVQVVVWENETDDDVAMTGGTLVPHSVFVIVDGGDTAEIANAIWLRKSGGCTMMGAVEETVTDTQGHDHTIKFSRPDDVDIYVEIDIETKSGWVSGTADDIKDAIVDASVEPGAVAIGGDSNGVFPWSDIVRWIAGLSGFSIDEIRIGTSPGPVTPWQNVSIDFDAIARFEVGNITVNLV